MADKVLWTEQAFAFEALHAPRSRAGVGFGKDKTLALPEAFVLHFERERRLGVTN